MSKQHTSKELEEKINLFLSWGEKVNYETYDWWDIWSDKFGMFSKKLYVKNAILGLPFVTFITFLDLYFPWYRKFIAKKRCYPISYAHMGLGYLNFYQIYGDKKYLKKSEEFGERLLAVKSPYANGLGWGMKHEWMTVKGLVPVDTPCNTQTAYGYELFSKLYDITKEEKYLNYLKLIAEHTLNDFKETETDEYISCSYSTMDDRRVVNANSYRMYILLDAASRFSNEKYFEKGFKTLKYVFKMQNDEGGWRYSEDQDFIDTYHTCFVLKNLLKTKKVLGEKFTEFESSFQKGLEYYHKNLFHENGIPKPYSVNLRLPMYDYDSYDIAESLRFLIEIDELNKINTIINFIFEKLQTKEGWFKFRLYKIPFVRQIPYIRYANSSMFYSLTSALSVTKKSERENK